MLDQVTKRKLDSARQILVGKVPGPKAQVEQITTALIYKFMDDMDKENEEVGLKTQFFIDDWKKFSWTKILDNKLSGQERLDLYVQAITNMPKNRIFLNCSEIFSKALFCHTTILARYRFFWKRSTNLITNTAKIWEMLLSICFLFSEAKATRGNSARHAFHNKLSPIQFIQTLQVNNFNLPQERKMRWTYTFVCQKKIFLLEYY